MIEIIANFLWSIASLLGGVIAVAVLGAIVLGTILSFFTKKSSK